MAASFLRPSTFGPLDHAYIQRRFSPPSTSNHRRSQSRLRSPAPLQSVFSQLTRFLAPWVLDVREMRKIEDLIVQGDDETVMAFRAGQGEAVGMVAVASAIISQLSSTTLQIPALSSINWTASAFIIAALLFSILATMLSCIQQQVLGTLNEPGGIRMWLSNGSAGPSSRSKKGGRELRGGQDREDLQTSVASLLLLRLPNAFLLYGVACYLIGFGLFLGLAWRQDLPNTPSRDNNFAVMVMYVVAGGVSVLGTAGVVKWKMAEVHHAEKVVGKDIEEGDDGEEEDGGRDGNEQGEGSGNGKRGNDDESGSEGEDNALLGRKTRSGRYSPKEAMDHERIARALEDAARAHRELAKLMNDALQRRQDS